MVERRSSQNRPEEMRSQERPHFSLDNPETWQKGDVIDLGGLNEFNNYRKRILLTSITDVINSVLKFSGEQYIKGLVRQVELSVDGLLSLTDTNIRGLISDGIQDNDLPHFFINKIHDLLISLEQDKEQSYCQGFLLVEKEVEERFSHSQDDFIAQVLDQVIKKVREEPYKKGLLYFRMYESLPVLLTVDEQFVNKLEVGGFGRIPDTENFYIKIRREAYNILEDEERQRGAEGLIAHLLEHEYQEILHAADRQNITSPHGEMRDPKYLEVLKVLRKRRYFHDLVT